MSMETVEQKLKDFERRLAAIEALASQIKPGGNWRDIVGWEQDDALFREAVKLGAAWRAKANAEGR